jgi:hypothetical protein
MKIAEELSFGVNADQDCMTFSILVFFVHYNVFVRGIVKSSIYTSKLIDRQVLVDVMDNEMGSYLSELKILGGVRPSFPFGVPGHTWHHHIYYRLLLRVVGRDNFVWKKENTTKIKILFKDYDADVFFMVFGQLRNNYDDADWSNDDCSHVVLASPSDKVFYDVNANQVEDEYQVTIITLITLIALITLIILRTLVTQ